MKDRISSDEQTYDFGSDKCEDVYDIFAELDHRSYDYTLNGEEIFAMTDFYEENDFLDPDDCLNILQLRPGEEINLGGGSAGDVIVKRIA